MRDTLKDIFAKPGEFIGGQVLFDHLGDVYRGKINHFTEEGGSIYIWLTWCAVWCDDAWRSPHDAFKAVEGLANHSLEAQEDGGFRFTPFIFRHGVLYPKGHKSNITQESLAPMATADIAHVRAFLES